MEETEKGNEHSPIGRLIDTTNSVVQLQSHYHTQGASSEDEFGKLYNDNYINYIYWSRLILSQFILWLSLITMTSIQIVGDQFYRPSDPLPDIIHTLLPSVFPTGNFVNLVESILVFSSLFIIIVLTRSHLRFTLFTRLAILISICYWVRAFAIAVTVIPDSLPDCKPNVVSNPQEFLTAVIMLMTGAKFSCTDVIISGHTLIIVNLWLILAIYFYKKTWVCLIVGIYAFFNMIICVTSHIHYTVDVFLALLLAIGIHYGYHACLDHSAGLVICNLLKHEVNNKSRNFKGYPTTLSNFPLFLRLSSAVEWFEALPQRMIIGARFYKSQVERSYSFNNSVSYGPSFKGSSITTEKHLLVPKVNIDSELLLRYGYMGTGEFEPINFCPPT